MKRPAATGALALAAALGFLAWWLWQGAGAATSVPAALHASGISRAAALDGAAGGQGRQWLSGVAGNGEGGAEGADLQRVPLLPVEQKQSAWLSMANARQNGDARTPPLQHDEAPPAAPDAALLADPKAYAEYQRSQHKQLLGAYASAAGAELPRLRADVERGRAAGVPAEEMAKLEQKIRLIEQQRTAAQQAQRAP